MRHICFILLGILASCNFTKQQPLISGKGPSNSNFDASPIEVEIPADRFQEFGDQNISYELSFSGSQATGTLNFAAGDNKILLQSARPSGDLSITFRLEDKDIFIAEQANISTQGQATYKLANCMIQPIEWSGKQNIDTCRWTFIEK